MSAQHITLNAKTYPLEALYQGDLFGQPTLSDYEKQVLQFCQQWLSGQDQFAIQTSGSTGTPKTISVTRAQMALSARLTGEALGLRSGDRALVCLSVEYIAGMMMVVRGFELGLQLTIIDPTSRPLAQVSPTTHFDFTAMVPLQLQETLAGTANERTLLNRMKAVLIGGAPVSAALQSRLQSVTAPTYHTYGMTETVSHIALKRLNGSLRSDYFVPFEEVALGLNKRGCLTIQSTLTQGEVLHTNDLVELRPDGQFRWLGRIDNVINSGGVKVQIEQVEQALEIFFYRYADGLFADRRFFVGAVDDLRLGQAIVAIIEGPSFDWALLSAEVIGEAVNGIERLSAETKTALRYHLGQYLKRFEIPRDFYFVPQLLETRTGKIDRRANLATIAQANCSSPISAWASTNPSVD